MWRHHFSPTSKHGFVSGQRIDSDKYHLAVFKALDDILALQNLLVPLFIPPYRPNSVLVAYLIPALLRSSKADKDSHGGRLPGLNRRDSFSGSASLTVVDKIIYVSLPHQLQCSYLHHWIRNWLKTKKLIHTLEFQNGPHQISVHRSSQRCISLRHCGHSAISHDIKPSPDIANIIQLTFSDEESSSVLSVSLIWCFVVQRKWWHCLVICSVFLTVRAAGHSLHCWRT